MQFVESVILSTGFTGYSSARGKLRLAVLMGVFAQHEAPVKIAQVSPLYESVPPKMYGGTERVVSFLTEELVAQGQDVTLFASGDSQTSAKLVPATNTSLRLSKNT